MELVVVEADLEVEGWVRLEVEVEVEVEVL